MSCRRSGFTLLELLVAVFLGSLAASMVVMSIRSPSPENAFQDEISKYARVFAFLSEQAMVENLLIGLYVDHSGFRILRLSRDPASTGSTGTDLTSRLIAMYDDYENKDWIPLNLPEIKEVYPFKDDFQVSFWVGGISYQGEDKGQNNTQMTEQVLGNSRRDRIYPQVFFYPSMEVTPFEMRFKSRTVRDEYFLSVQETGAVILKNGLNDENPESF